MKRLIIAVTCCVLGAVAMAQEVHSQNVAGVIKVRVDAGKLAIVGVNLDAINDADATLEGVLGGKLLAGDEPGDGDQVLMWDQASLGYKSFQRKTSDGGKFHAANNPSEWSAPATNPPVGPGNAFWIWASSSGPVDLALTGQAVKDTQMTVTVVPQFQFVCYPFSCVIGINQTDLVNDGALKSDEPGDGDELLFWTGTGYQSYAAKMSDGKWYRANNPTEWNGSQTADTIDLGVGFWYLSRKGTSWDWTEANLYLGNL